MCQNHNPIPCLIASIDSVDGSIQGTVVSSEKCCLSLGTIESDLPGPDSKLGGSGHFPQVSILCEASVASKYDFSLSFLLFKP